MFDYINFDENAIASVVKIVTDANNFYGAGAMERVNHAVRILSGQIEPERSPHPMQKPNFYFPGLPAKPWHDPSEIEEVAVLEAAYETIKGELINILGENRGFQEPPPVDKYILKAGVWDIFRIKDGCQNLEENWALCPETKKIVDSLTRISESTIFSALGPRAFIQPHCGVANLRLTIHLGLIVPDDCRLTVSNETRAWEEGACLVFDDSFVHEVRNNSDETRVVLIVDIWHPDLTAPEVEVLKSLLYHLDS